LKPISPTTFKQLQAYFHGGQSRPHAELALQHLRLGAKVQSCFVLDDNPEKWKAFFEKSFSQFLTERSGYLYVASSTEQPGWFKLGKTKSAPESRMKALNNEAVLGEIRCEFSLHVHDRHYCEIAAHKWLSARGVHRKKEFFKTDLKTMEESCRRVFEEDLLHLLDLDVSPLLPEPFSSMRL
jgi:hypothetical protein